jgi:hypothetical protein
MTTWTKAITNWKSTLSGLLTVTLATSTALLTIPAVQNHVKAVGWLMGVQAVVKVWVSLIQVDAGTALAKVPGESEPVAVPSHEVPDNPSAKPVTGEN